MFLIRNMLYKEEIQDILTIMAITYSTVLLYSATQHPADCRAALRIYNKNNIGYYTHACINTQYLV